MKKFSISGGSGISLKNHALCGRKTAFKLAGYSLQKVNAALKTGIIVHDAINKHIITKSEQSEYIEEAFGEALFDDTDFLGTSLLNEKNIALQLYKDVQTILNLNAIKPENSELSIEVPLTNPETGEVHFENEAVVCGKIDLIEELKIIEKNYEPEPLKRKTSSSVEIEIDGEKKLYNKTDYELIKKGYKNYELCPFGDSSLCITDIKTSSIVSKNMDNHAMQVCAMYPYLYYIKYGKIPKYASIIELNKKGKQPQRLFEKVKEEDIYNAFLYIKHNVEQILNKVFIPNYSSCNQFFQCMYYPMCFSHRFKDPQKIIKEYFKKV